MYHPSPGRYCNENIRPAAKTMKWRSLEESNETDIRPLREIYAERKGLIEKYVPQEIRDVHARVVAELKASVAAESVLPVAARVQNFELKDHDGKLVSSAELLSNGRLVSCFIRGRWCAFCVGQV